MKVTSRIRAGVTIVSVYGRVFRHRADVFASWIHVEVGDRYTGAVLLDAGEMTYINSAGMVTILRLARRCARHGGRFALCGLAEGIDRAFEVLGFDRIIDTYDSADEAMAALSHEPESHD